MEGARRGELESAANRGSQSEMYALTEGTKIGKPEAEMGGSILSLE